MSLDITPGDGIVGELELLGDLIVGGFPEAVFTLPGVSVDEVLDHARLYLGFAEAAESAHARVRGLEVPEFVGVEGEFFRGRVPGELAMQLGAAVESYSRVGSGIKELARELDASQAALKPLEARARAVFEHMQKVWIKVNVPFTEYSGLRSEWDELVRAAGVVHERVAVAGQQAAAAINAGTEAMVPVNDYFSTLPGGAVAGGVVAQGARSTASRAASAAGGVTGAPGRAAKATADGLGAVAGAVTSVPQQITARGQQLAPQVTPDGIKVGDQLLTDPTSEQAQKLVRDGQATNILGLDPTGVPTAMMMLASPNTLLREQPRKKSAGRRWSGEESKAQSIAENAVGQVVSVPGRFVGGAVDRFGNTIAGNAALIGVGGDPVRAWTGLAKNVTSPVAGAGRAVASATPEQILADPIAAAGSAATHAPAAVPFVGWVYGLVEWATKPGELAREGAKESLTSALDALTLKNLEAGQAVANTGEVQVTTSDVDVHADNGGYVTFTLPDLEGGEPKAWYILATPDSPGNFTTNVPTGLDEELVERADGSVVLVNSGTGQIVRTIKTPWAKDALGRDQPTWYSIDKVDDQTSTITQHIAPNKNALYPLVADAPGGAGAGAGAGSAVGSSSTTPGADAEFARIQAAIAAQNAPKPAAPQPAIPTPLATPVSEVPANPKYATPPSSTAEVTQAVGAGLGVGTADRKPDADVSITLPKDGGGATVGVGQAVQEGGGKVTEGPHRTDGDVTVSADRSDGSGVTDVTSVSTAVVPAAKSQGQQQRVTDTVTSTQDRGSGVETVTGRSRQVDAASAAESAVADAERAPVFDSSGLAQAAKEYAESAATGVPREKTSARAWAENFGTNAPVLQDYFLDGVHPVSKVTGVDNGVQYAVVTMSDGSLLTIRGTPGQDLFTDRFAQFQVKNSPLLGNADLDPHTGKVSPTPGAGEVLLQGLDTASWALVFIPGGQGLGAGGKVVSVAGHAIISTGEKKIVEGATAAVIKREAQEAARSAAARELAAQQAATQRAAAAARPAGNSGGGGTGVLAPPHPPITGGSGTGAGAAARSGTGGTATSAAAGGAGTVGTGRQAVAGGVLAGSVPVAGAAAIAGVSEHPTTDQRPDTDNPKTPDRAPTIGAPAAPGSPATPQPTVTPGGTPAGNPPGLPATDPDTTPGGTPAADPGIPTVDPTQVPGGLPGGTPAATPPAPGEQPPTEDTPNHPDTDPDTGKDKGTGTPVQPVPAPSTNPDAIPNPGDPGHPGESIRIPGQSEPLETGSTPPDSDSPVEPKPSETYKPFTTTPGKLGPDITATTAGNGDGSESGGEAGDNFGNSEGARNGTDTDTAADGKPRAFNADGTIAHPDTYLLTDPATWDPVRFFSTDTYNHFGALAPAEAGNRFENVTNPIYKDRGLFTQVYLLNLGPKGGYLKLDYLKPGDIIGSQKLTQAAETPEQFKFYIDEFAKKYSPGSDIAPVPSSESRGLKGEIEGHQILILPPQKEPIPDDLLKYASRKGVYVVDITGKVYNEDTMPSALPKEVIDALDITRKP